MKKNIAIDTIIILVFIGSILFSGCFDIYERSPVQILSFSPDGNQLITYDSESIIQNWNLSTGEELYQFDWRTTNYITTAPSVVDWMDGGAKFILADTHKMRIFNTISNKEIWNTSGYFSYLDISESGFSLSTSWTHFEGHQPIFNITLWDLEKKVKIKVLNATTKSKLSISQTGSSFVHIPTSGYSLEIVNVSNENITKTLNLSNQSVLDISKCHYIKWLEEDSRIAMVANFKNDGVCFYYWNASDGSIILKKNYSFYMIYPSFSPDGMKFIMSSGKEASTNISVVDTITGEVVFSLYLSEKGVSSTDWSPDGSLIAAGSNDGIIKVWDATTGELIQTLLTPKDHRVPL